MKAVVKLPYVIALLGGQAFPEGDVNKEKVFPQNKVEEMALVVWKLSILKLSSSAHKIMVKVVRRAGGRGGFCVGSPH